MPRSVRDIAIALFLLAIGLVTIFSSLGNPAGGPLSRFAYTVARPFQEAVFTVKSGLKGLWLDYVALIDVQTENRKLKAQIRHLRQERTILLNKAGENRRLKKLLDLKSTDEFPSLVAQVIGDDAVGWYRTFLINRGSDDGVLPNMSVTVAEGLVGRVVKSSGGMSQVLLITDPGLSVDCRVARTRDRGVLTGSLDKGCILRYIKLKSGIRAGDEIITSGLDGIFPRGLSVGRVKSVRRGGQGLFLEAMVIPSVDFSEIEEVLVVLGVRGGFDIGWNLERER